MLRTIQPLPVHQATARPPARLARRLAAVALASSAVFGALVPLQGVVHAAAPAQQKTQGPGFYRMAVGEFVVTALYDGYIDLDRKLLKGATAADLQRLLARAAAASTPSVQTAVNAFLVDTGRQLILVDAGSAKCFGPTLGSIGENLRAAGYEPAQVDAVLLTHLHPDHACGLAGADGQAVFPNAQVLVARPEADFWLSEQRAAQAPQANRPFFDMARASVAPYASAGRLKTYRAGEALVPGVRAVESHGHTPGHVSYLFESGKDRLLVWGDIVHSHAVQFARPEVTIEFDVDGKQAIASRRRLLADAVRDGWWVAGAHLPFPGIGHVRAESRGYAWVPLEYGPIRTDR